MFVDFNNPMRQKDLVFMVCGKDRLAEIAYNLHMTAVHLAVLFNDPSDPEVLELDELSNTFEAFAKAAEEDTPAEQMEAYYTDLENVREDWHKHIQWAVNAGARF